MSKKELMDVYTFLAAYKRLLGKQMEVIETKMKRLEAQIGLSHHGAMEMRVEGTDLLKKAVDV